MVWQTVKSSNIARIRHRENDLYVEFNSGAIYRYYSVSDQVVEDLLSADSVGKFINNNIKGKFIYEQTKPASKADIT